MNAWCITWISIVAATAGCSGGSSGGSNGGSNGSGDSCGKVAPCGGNIVGTWKIVDDCSTGGSSPMAIAGCAGGTGQVTSTHASGTLTVNADMTYTLSETSSEAETVIFPASCLTSGGVTLTCSDLQTTLSASLPDDAGLGSFSTTCATSGSGCTCTTTSSSPPVTASGTYSTSGNTLMISTPGSTPSSGEYCVQGNTLHVLIPTSTAVGTPTTGQMTGATTSTDLVATK